MPESAWWKGRRGEWYVVVQVALFALVIFGPRTWRGWPSWAFPDHIAVGIVGVVLLVAGGCLLVGGGAKLGSKLTPLPYPQSGGTLQQSGAFCLVRHPMYCGGVLAAVGWAMVSRGWLTLAYAALVFLFADVKSRREEAWLVEAYPEYTAYKRRVRRLIPFVY
jgi:protein-S-isoprenylcysteine O-methyltransferase Ste14